MMHRTCCWAWMLALLISWLGETGRAAESFASHEPQRPLPTPSDRPLGQGPARYVDPQRGDDQATGARETPWRTLNHAVGQLQPGETLYLRGGVYFERVRAVLRGEVAKPITIRAYPGELPVVDGGIPEFQTAPADAWEPFPEGAPGEYRSRQRYPGLNVRNEGVHLLGRFADSLTPLHGYSVIGDLRSDNIYWNLEEKVGKQNFIYCGPGVFYDPMTERIHVRLAPTGMPYLAERDNYRGEQDPRRIPLIISGQTRGPAFSLRGSQYVRLYDLVIRGAAESTFELLDSQHVVLDGLTCYGGSHVLRLLDSAGVRIMNTACRGIAAPWTFRGSLKYRAVEARLVSTGGWAPRARYNRDFEIVDSEFTDSVDGVFLGNVARVQFHRNLVENVSDDGMFMTSGTDFNGLTPGGGHVFTQNRFARCLTTFAFGVGHGRQKVFADHTQTGADVWVTRNVFDLRATVPYHQPRSPDAPAEVTSYGRLAGDHGSPAWEPIYFYHNTVLQSQTPFRSSYGSFTGGLGGGAPRRLFNNLFLNVQGSPGFVLPEVAKGPGPAPLPNLQVDGNVHWSADSAQFDPEEFLRQLRRLVQLADERSGQNTGWAAHDQAADPGVGHVAPLPAADDDLRLVREGGAIDRGRSLDSTWLDPLREHDAGLPDVGALPRGVEPWRVGVRGRLKVSGQETAERTPLSAEVSFLDRVEIPSPWQPGKPAAIVEGYPAPDVPLLLFGLEQQGLRVETFERTWLPPSRYHEYRVVVVVGDLVRAKIENPVYSEADLVQVEKFLNDGGTLLLLGRGKEAFRSQPGLVWLSQRLGWERSGTAGELAPRVEGHPWTAHLNATNSGWLATLGGKNENLLKSRLGDRLLADAAGHSILTRQSIGQGELVYLGWSIANSLPATRDRKSQVEMEASYEAQMRILQQILASSVARQP